MLYKVEKDIGQIATGRPSQRSKATNKAKKSYMFQGLIMGNLHDVSSEKGLSRVIGLVYLRIANLLCGFVHLNILPLLFSPCTTFEHSSKYPIH